MAPILPRRSPPRGLMRSRGVPFSVRDPVVPAHRREPQRWLPEQGAGRRAWAGNAIAGLVFLFCGVFLAVFGVSALAAARSWPEIPVTPVQDEALGPRFHANVPVGTDQCWDAPLPCAPDFRSPSLRDGHVLMWRSIEAGQTGP